MARRAATLLAELRAAWGEGDWEVGVRRGAGRRVCWVRRGDQRVAVGRDLRSAVTLALASVEPPTAPPRRRR